jgi:hypothetical protein
MNDMYFMRDTQFPSNLSSSFFSGCHTVDMDTYTHRALRPVRRLQLKKGQRRRWEVRLGC